MEIEELLGKVLIHVVATDTDIEFITYDEEHYMLYHEQDCCESVYIEDIEGDLDDLINSPILQAEEVSSENKEALSAYDESYTWTFYKLATIKGYVTIRFYGTSNGYYSESVTFCKLKL